MIGEVGEFGEAAAIAWYMSRTLPTGRFHFAVSPSSHPISAAN